MSRAASQEVSVELEALEPFSDSLDDILDPDTQPPRPGGIVGCLTVHKMKLAVLFVGAFALLAYVTGRPHPLAASNGTFDPNGPFDASFGIKCEAGQTAGGGGGDGSGGGFTQDVRSRRLSQTEAHARAWELTRRMTLAEKMRMVVGVGWRQYAAQPGFYVGNIPAIPRLGVPSINMQDGPQGFRTLDARLVGTVTAWPCMLAVGATWDAGLAREYGAGLGREFKTKGANVILGPSVNVHRVPRNGRNGEYLSGEEPLLGAVLGAAVVRGTQAEGVAATVKHFVLNSQETNRNTQASEVDARTLHEVYYPPFAAAVAAGAASVMCSYNRVRSSAQPAGLYEHACGNAQVLQTDLKGEMGFEGWVMSDWWAVHDGGAAAAGVDQELPGTPAGDNRVYFTAPVLARLSGGMASDTQLLQPPFGGGVKSVDGTADGELEVDSTGDSTGQEAWQWPWRLWPFNSRALGTATSAGSGGGAGSGGAGGGASRSLGTSAAPETAPETDRLSQMVARVLGGMLACGAFNTSVCAAGCDCEAALYEADATSEAHRALARRVGAASAVLLKNEDGALPLRPGARVVLAGSACSQRHVLAESRNLDWRAGDYYVLGGSGRVIAKPEAAVSIRQGLEARGVLAELRASESDDVDEALALVRSDTDVVVACGGATSSESLDRADLKLDQHEFLLELTRRLQTGPNRTDDASGTEARPRPRLVVLALAPGTVLMPWADKADAAMVTFLAGEQSGNAWADVLLGEVNPSGRLPLTLPRTEEDVVAPCVEDVCVYEERLAVGWRALVNHPVAFPFGHGLSYTRFAYTWLATPQRHAASGEVRFSVRVTNGGDVPGAEVCQVYLSYPEAAGEPPLVLRGFTKTALLPPGGHADLAFALTPRDLSTYAADGWAVSYGEFAVSVGASSRDVRLRGPFHYSY